MIMGKISVYITKLSTLSGKSNIKVVFPEGIEGHMQKIWQF